MELTRSRTKQGLIFLATWVAASTAVADDMRLMVDATQAQRGFYHSTIEMPISAGRNTLLYPKWMPGEHSPSGPIEGLMGITLSSDGKPLTWRRDPDNMFAFHFSAPASSRNVRVEMDFTATASAGMPGSYGHTSNLAVVNWHPMLLFLKGQPADEIMVSPALTIPDGWHVGGALPIRHREGSTIEFERVSLSRLIDSPVVIGRHYRKIELPVKHSGAPKHYMDLVAESEWALDVPEKRIQEYGIMVDEALDVMRSWHYGEYHFLVSLTGHFGVSGLEHHASSDNRVPENFFVDDGAHKDNADLLCHELFHSWNGKTLRPRGLMSPDYQTPMEGELLWIYEGLTFYYGDVLACRAGWVPAEEMRERIAGMAARYERASGRSWRPLRDTADAAQVQFGAGRAWGNWRRGVDFYAEGGLIWLEADVKIRTLTAGKKSLDDFCREFFSGGRNGEVSLRAYDVDDIYATMGRVAPNDWRTFFEERVEAANAPAPLGGIVNGGWKLTFDDKPNKGGDGDSPPVLASLPFTIGAWFSGDGRVVDVIPGRAAHTAGIGPGMRVIAVNGRGFSPDVLGKAVADAKKSKQPMAFLIENKDFYSTLKVDYTEGEQHPHLTRDETKVDYLGQILAPRTPVPEAKKE
jgi:predicted metalloprotease with PDZ domain